jgi:hypothetical protein
VNRWFSSWAVAGTRWGVTWNLKYVILSVWERIAGCSKFAVVSIRERTRQSSEHIVVDKQGIACCSKYVVVDV